MIAPAGFERPDHELDVVAGFHAEGDELPDLADGAGLGIAARGGEAGALQHRLGMSQRIGIAQLEADRLAGIESIDIDQRVVAIVGAEIGRCLGAVDELQAEDAAGEVGRALQIGGAEPDVAQLLDGDRVAHSPRCSFWRSLSAIKTSDGPSKTTRPWSRTSARSASFSAMARFCSAMSKV